MSSEAKLTLLWKAYVGTSASPAVVLSSLSVRKPTEQRFLNNVDHVGPQKGVSDPERFTDHALPTTKGLLECNLGTSRTPSRQAGNRHCDEQDT